MSSPNAYKVRIGLEVHAQLSLQRKMFAPEGFCYGGAPNTQVSVVSLAHPGTLPRVNVKAIQKAMQLGLACQASITRFNHFDRKNYFYPDLPKGYQITQQHTPLCTGGQVCITRPDGSTKAIALQRIHLEEDTGKSIHAVLGHTSLLDYNRAGAALIEIVTEPVMEAAEEAYRFLTELRKLVRYLEVCDGNMEEGSLRCDANVSVARQDGRIVGQRVEVKNMNSIRNVQMAIDYEITRQIDLLERGQDVPSETRSYRAQDNTTRFMRAKENSSQYRYFPEPDLLPFSVSDDQIEQIRQSMPMLPSACLDKFITQYGLSNYDATVLSEDKETALFLDAVCQHTGHYKAAANWILGPVKAYLNDRALGLHDFPIDAAGLAALVDTVAEGTVSFSTAAKQLYPAMLTQPQRHPKALALALGLTQTSSTEETDALMQEVLDAYSDKVTLYRNGKKGLLGMFVAEVMKRSTKNVSPKTISERLKDMLDRPL